MEGEGSMIRMADLAGCLEEVEEEASLTKEVAPPLAVTLVAADSLTKEAEIGRFVVVISLL